MEPGSSKSKNELPVSHATTYVPPFDAISHTIKAYLVTPQGDEILVRILLDEASHLVLVRKKVADAIDLKGEEVTLKMIVSGNQLSVYKHQKSVTFKLRSVDKSFISESIPACTIPAISKKLKSLEINPKLWNHLRDLKFSETLPITEESHFDVLLGEPFVSRLKLNKSRKGQTPDSPGAELCSLGWYLVGAKRKDNETPHSLAQKVSVDTMTSLKQKINDFWDLEVLGMTESVEEDPELKLDEAIAEQKMKEITTYNAKEKCYTTGLLWKDQPIQVTNLRKAHAVAYKFLQKYQSKPEKKKQIDAAYAEMVKNGFAEVLENDTKKNDFYIMETMPVERNHSTTPIRVVFNASSVDKSGNSLNRAIHMGKCLVPDLVGILLRFRVQSWVFSCDLSKFFHRIKMDKKSQDYLRYCWSFNEDMLKELNVLKENPIDKPSDPPTEPNASPHMSHSKDFTLQHLRMKVLPMGLTSSPYQASWVLHHHAKKYQQRSKEACNILLQNSYVDDLSGGSMFPSKLVQIIRDIKFILDQASFKSHKWVCNKEGLLQEAGLNDNEIAPSHITKILGITWDSKTDHFIWPFLERPKEFSTSVIEDAEDSEVCPNRRQELPILQSLSQENWTMRQLFSIVLSVFSPCGEINPYLLGGKCAMQNCWRAGLSWDNSLTPEILEQFTKFKEELPLLNQFKLNRCVIPNNGVAKFISVFSDASLNDGYGACVYITSEATNPDKTKTRSSRLIFSKTRVHSLKEGHFSIVRKELQGCVIATRIGLYVKEALGLNVPIFYFTDSLANLIRISKLGKTDGKAGENYKCWEARRLLEVSSKTSPNQWFWTAGTNNPAHFLTKPCSLKFTMESNLWQEGPTYLVEENVTFKNADSMVMTQDLRKLDEEGMVKAAISHATSVLDPISNINEEFLHSLLNRFESWKSNLNVFAFVLRFIKNTRNKVKCAKFKGDYKKEVPELDVTEVTDTSYTFIRLAQQEVYKEILNPLRNKVEIPFSMLKKHRVEDLLVFWDPESKLLKMDSRLRFSALLSQVGCPILLPSKHAVTAQIVKWIHKQFLHCSVEQTLCQLRRQYWVQGSRRTVKSILRHCPVCKVPRKLGQTMAPLPALRTEIAKPWAFLATDHAGPLYLIENAKKSHKVYILLFTDYLTRGVHLELCWSMGTEDFLRALRKMTARRGYPSRIYSDHSKSFKAADKELKRLLSKLDWNNIQKVCKDKYSTTWDFTPSVHSPWTNSLCESLFSPIKKALRASLGSSRIVKKKQSDLTFEELETLLIEIEGILNSRPLNLTYETPQGGSLIAITPNELWSGRQTALLPDEAKINPDIPLSRKWHNRKMALNAFWRRYISDYLLQFSVRKIWNKPANPRQLQIGDFVQCRDPGLAKGKWLNGIVIKVHPNPLDGLVRRVTIKTTSGSIINRSIQNLALFEESEEVKKAMSAK